MAYGFDWFEYFLRNPEETEAVVMARVGIGEGREDNILDQDLVMWTLKTRKVIGFTRPGYPATINSVVTRSNEQYHVIGILAGVFGGDPYTDPAGYAATDLSRCTQNVMRMVFPCGPKEQEYLDDLDRAYNQAQIILATDIHEMPPGLKYFESFVGEGASEGTWCPWGDTDRSRLRPSENLAGSTVFFDCLLLDNQMIWDQE